MIEKKEREKKERKDMGTKGNFVLENKKIP